MTLTKSNSLFPVATHFFDDLLTKDMFNWNLGSNFPIRQSLPSVNIIENNDFFAVEMAVPGMAKQDFQIELDNGTLTISAEEGHAHETDEDIKYTRKEFVYTSFKRSFFLPKAVVDESQIKAKYEAGILKILIPKKEEAKALPPRQIEIK